MFYDLNPNTNPFDTYRWLKSLWIKTNYTQGYALYPRDIESILCIHRSVVIVMSLFRIQTSIPIL
jgi:hypothetical protein